MWRESGQADGALGTPVGGLPREDGGEGRCRVKEEIWEDWAYGTMLYGPEGGKNVVHMVGQ